MNSIKYGIFTGKLGTIIMTTIASIVIQAVQNMIAVRGDSVINTFDQKELVRLLTTTESCDMSVVP